ncbi:MAG TPA: alpha-glucan family phosphorylase [Thermoanaerobaculia bacterium]|nr:alpha-glucan family phosphorylase [Thermoanaerobaculia bacterium]
MIQSAEPPHPRLPTALHPLWGLARDLRWTWRPTMRALFASLDRAAWEENGGDPVDLLLSVPPERLEQAAGDLAFLAQMSAVQAELAMEDASPSWHPAVRTFRERGYRIAYFSAEFGLTEHLPIYAGGLGILAGDVLKSSSDRGLPVVGVGLFYREDYFRQVLDKDGWQHESNPPLDPERLPISLPLVPGGGRPLVQLTVGDRDVSVLVRFVRVGRVPLVLLDTNVPENAQEDRDITARLYGGDQETRIRQELVLGIGGLRALELLGMRPTIRHINEGHAAFVGLEKIRLLVTLGGLTFPEARERAAATNVFTTHTPVPAGIDHFPPELVEKYLTSYVAGAGLSWEEFRKLGQDGPPNPSHPFSMAVLALRLCGHVNAVSQLHARVSRRLWLGLLPELADEDIRIRAITNGVHRVTWTDPEVAKLPVVDDPDTVDRAVFWRVHEGLRARLVALARRRLVEERKEQGASSEEIEEASRVLDPAALTIGFAKRFTTYKRPGLIFHDPERLKRILDGKPVQIIFAGKAHPHDDPGKQVLREVAQFCRRPEFRGRVVLLSDYNMRLARAMVTGCDVWLNNPIRPREACGTSGMKAAMNGVLNLSVLDGWWDEAPYEETGFTIGPAIEDHPDDQTASSLYDVLERQVLPLFFDRNEQGLPLAWVEKMVQSAALISRHFSADRMMIDYLEDCYAPGAEWRFSLLGQGGERLRAGDYLP